MVRDVVRPLWRLAVIGARRWRAPEPGDSSLSLEDLRWLWRAARDLGVRCLLRNIGVGRRARGHVEW